MPCALLNCQLSSPVFVDYLQDHAKGSTLLGFKGGPAGIMKCNYVEITKEFLYPYRNQVLRKIFYSCETLESPLHFFRCLCWRACLNCRVVLTSFAVEGIRLKLLSRFCSESRISNCTNDCLLSSSPRHTCCVVYYFLFPWEHFFIIYFYDVKISSNKLRRQS
jgi:hypothetical protein